MAIHKDGGHLPSIGFQEHMAATSDRSPASPAGLGEGGDAMTWQDWGIGPPELQNQGQMRDPCGDSGSNQTQYSYVSL